MSFHFYRVCSWIANTDHLSIDSSCDNVERDLWAAVNIRVAAIETNWNPAAGRSTAIQRSPRYLGLLWRDLVSLAHIISEPIMAPSPRSFGESVIRFRGGRGPLFFARATKKNQSSSLSLSLHLHEFVPCVRHRRGRMPLSGFAFNEPSIPTWRPMNLRRGRGTKSMLSPVSRLFRFFASALTNARRLFSQPVHVLWNIDRFHISSSFFFLSPSIIEWIKLDVARLVIFDRTFTQDRGDRSWTNTTLQFRLYGLVRRQTVYYNWSTCDKSSLPILYT